MSTPAAAPGPSGFSFSGYITTPGLNGVSFWPRAAARVLDTLFHTLIGYVAGFGLGIMIAIVAMATGRPVEYFLERLTQPSPLTFVLAVLGFTAYHTICEWLHGSTLGKLLLGQVVVAEEQTPCNFRSALVRNLAYFIDSLFLGAVGYFAMQKTDLNQRHGDTWARTIVRKRSELPGENLRGGKRFALVLLLAAGVDGCLVILGHIIVLL